jgi:hypothetical protein
VGGRQFGAEGKEGGKPSTSPHHPLLPPLGRGEKEGPRGPSGGCLTFPDGAIRRWGVVCEEEAGSVSAVAAPASRCDRALVLWGHGGLVNGRAVLMGQCSCCWIPIGAGICIPQGQRDTEEIGGGLDQLEDAGAEMEDSRARASRVWWFMLVIPAT